MFKIVNTITGFYAPDKFGYINSFMTREGANMACEAYNNRECNSIYTVREFNF